MHDQNLGQIDHPTYWKSLEEYHGQITLGDEFLHPDAAFPRRDFLKLMGASLALAGTACVRRPIQKIVPYVHQPEEITPGVANEYSSTWVDSGEAYGLIVKTREGRPIKLEGNPAHPVNQGGLTARVHAHLLNLYDPDRIRQPQKISGGGAVPTDWEALDEGVKQELAKGGVAILTSSLASPATEALIDDFLGDVSGKLYTWDVLGADDLMEGQAKCFGSQRREIPRYRFNRAQMIVSIDTDFLGTYLSPAEFARQFSLTRQPGENFSRLVIFESMLSLTGANADQRFRILPSQQVAVVMGLLHEIIVKQKQSQYAQQESVISALKKFDTVPASLGVSPADFAKVASELWANRGKSLIVAGGMTTRTRNYLSLQIATQFLNHVLENDGSTLDYEASPISSYRGHSNDLAQLINRMNNGEIKTLIIHNSNPAYLLPRDSRFLEGLKKVKTVISTADRIDETAKLGHFLAPDHHPMENWGDAEIHRGVFSIQQPTVRPLYNTRAFQDSLITWSRRLGKSLGHNKDWHSYLRNYWEKNIFNKFGGGTIGAGSFEAFWIAVLQQGVFDISLQQAERSLRPRPFNTATLSEIKSEPPNSAKTSVELVLYPTIALADGKLANVSWLQELPDPVTKIVWDNYLNVSLKMAEEMGLSEGDVVGVISATESTNQDVLMVPIHIQPGLADRAVALAIGYGRTDVGVIGNQIGVNGYRLSSFKNFPVYSGIPVVIKKTLERQRLANTQGHHHMEGRAIVVEAANDDYKKDPGAGIHRHPTPSIWPKHEYSGHKWAMSVDLTKCTGCSACVVACQAENNIQVVGKERVLKGREMHWMRIDRYYTGDDTNPGSVFQPMMCQHCDNAPCETVCPVVATSHSNEGLNEMIYNRCVGTRYCANNCHYKVRRFNWFEYAEISYPLSMALNPAVTTRTRGVMEKCSFCVQRIKEAKNSAQDKGVPLKDGDIVTACEQSCPSKAIVFGDMNDPKSRVSQAFGEKRTYKVLEEFNAEPAVQYLSKVRNAPVAHHGSHSSDPNGDHKGGGHGSNNGPSKGSDQKHSDSHNQKAHKDIHS